MEAQRQPVAVCSQSWSSAVEGGVMSSGNGKDAVDSGLGGFTNTSQRIVIQSDSMRAQQTKVFCLTELVFEDKEHLLC